MPAHSPHRRRSPRGRPPAAVRCGRRRWPARATAVAVIALAGPAARVAEAAPPVGSAPVAVGLPSTEDRLVVQGPTVPPQFGFYGTRWRRWNATDTMPAKAAETTTPIAPPRSVVPGFQEEALADPRAAGQRAGDADAAAPARPLPPAADAPAEGAAPGAAPQRQPPADRRLEPLPPPDDGEKRPARPDAAGLPKTEQRATRQFLAQLSRDTAAAAAGSAAQQAEFTQRLIGELLAAHDPEARQAIVEAVAAFDTPAAAAICTGALEDPSPAVRMAACTACGKRGGPDAVPLLAKKSLTDTDLGVRLRAIKTLGDAGDQAAATALVALLDDPDPAVRGRAIEALKRASGRNLGDDPEAWRRWAAGPRTPAARWSMTEAIRRLF